MSKKLIYLFSFVLVLGVTAGVTNGGSLWGYYPINENDLNDYSGNDHHGTAVDGPVTVLDAERGWVVAFNDQPSLPSRINCGTDDPSASGELSVSIWIKWDGLNGNWQGMAGKSFQYEDRRWIFQLQDSDGMIQWGGTDQDNLHIFSTVAPAIGEWQHVAGTCDGSYSKVYINGEIVGEGPGGFRPDAALEANVTLGFGEDRDDYDESFNGLMDEIYIYNRTLSDNQIVDLFHGIPASFVKADDPNPANGALHADIWANLSWSPGDTAVSHDVYVGDNFDDVNEGIGDTFQGNQNAMFIVVGFPGFAFPDGLIPGMTYYWRIDEVEADGTTIHKGNAWSFMVPPKTAYYPDPADGAEFVAPDVQLSWTGGFGAKLHTVYFGDNFDEVDNATGGLPQGVTTYSPDTLKMAKTYYWRVDEFDVIDTHKGNVWSFTTEGAVGSPDPSNGAVDVKHMPILTWTPGVYAASHQVFFGADEDAVKNADTSSPEYKGSGNLGAESYEPEKLEWNSTYYWRIVEVNNTNPDSPWTGNIWSFTIANFLVADDFESYNDLDPDDPESNRIFNVWLDGYDDPTNGSLVGYENPPFAEQTIVHGGSQSIPLYYDNSVGYSEATLTLTYPRDWTENGITTLSIWFRGVSDNAAETLYVVLNGSAVVSHDNPNAAQTATWTEWVIPLQAFADQGVNLANVNTIALGLGDRNNPQAGGSGTMYFDDIRLYPPPPVDPNTDGLVAYYAFENDANDSSGNGLHGTVVGDPAYVEGLAGYGMAMDFDGTDDVVELGKFDVVGGITLAVWIKADDFEINDARVISKANEWGGDDHWWMLSTMSETSLRFRLKTDEGPGTATLISEPVLEPGVWTHVVAAWDGSMMRIYKDGVEVASQEKGGSAVAVDPAIGVAIGSQPSDAFASDPSHVAKFFDGLLDEVRIYNRALSDLEVRYLAGDR